MKMLKFLIFVILVGQAYAVKSAGGRIVNGTDAEEGEFPFVVNLRINQFYNFTNLHQCGATILNEKFILAAGHCVSCNENGTAAEDPSGFNVQYGLLNITTDDTNSVNISKFHCNNLTWITDGDYVELDHDLLIVELETPLPDDGSWEPVTLSRSFNTTVQREGVIIGWGYLDMDLTPAVTLQKLTVDIYDNDVCGADTRGDVGEHICVGTDDYSGPCWGDSGTALLVDGVQVGVTSYLTTTPVDCAGDNATYPAVYARVEKYLDWILSITPDVQSK